MRISEQIRVELKKNDRLCEDFPDIWEMLQESADMLDVYYIQCKAVTGAERLGQAKVYVRHALAEDV